MLATSPPIQQFEATCRAQGLPVTVQRRRILEALLGRTDHPTPDQVYGTVKDTLPGVSRTTVYRVLEMLTSLGVLTRACSPGAATRVDPHTTRHHHLVCRRCDRLIDVGDAAVAHRIRPPDVRREGFAIEDYSIYFTGLCAACQETDTGSRRSGRPARRSGRKGKTAKRTAPRP
jgi:Fe2+ or Zn2+ uptake regulation protein